MPWPLFFLTFWGLFGLLMFSVDRAVNRLGDAIIRTQKGNLT
jgi:hypothetical protein